MPISRLIVNIRYAVVQLNKAVERCLLRVIVFVVQHFDVVCVSAVVVFENSLHEYESDGEYECNNDVVELLWERQEVNVDSGSVVAVVGEEMAVKEVCTSWYCCCCCCCCVNRP